MRGGMLPPAIVCCALGLALAPLPVRARTLCIALLGGISWIVASARLPTTWSDSIFIGCWVSVILCAASVHVPRSIAARGAILLSTNAGIWAGAVVSVAGSKVDLVRALPFVLVALPAAWSVSNGKSLPIKVASSWLIAVAILASFLQFLPVTPGYLPDHME